MLYKLFFVYHIFIFYADIEWPQDDEALSDNAVEAVEEFLTMEPINRPTAKDVQKMKFFESLDWENLQLMEPPFIPNPDCPTDTGYFEGTFFYCSIVNIHLFN